MDTSSQQAIDGFLASNFCFDKNLVISLMAAMGGAEKFAAISWGVVDSDYTMDLMWLTSCGELLSDDNMLAIAIISDHEKNASIRGDVNNLLVVARGVNEGLKENISAEDLVRYCLKQGVGDRDKHDLLWRVIKDFAVRRVATDFCEFCSENDITIAIDGKHFEPTYGFHS
ncbi:MAG: hypothetical protein ACTIJH_11870 [Moraxellaceae bacterium]